VWTEIELCLRGMGGLIVVDDDVAVEMVGQFAEKFIG
jgi:hypothetical protein